MLLRLHDQDGDPIAIESSAICALSVGTVNGPRAARSALRVTLIHTVAGPLMAADSFDSVLEDWCAGRNADRRQTVAHPDAIPWKFHPVVEGSTG